MELNEYTEGVDFKFLDAMGITVKRYQPWQLGLFNEELKGKFVWYPKNGTLMFEGENGIYKVGEFLASEDKTEDVYLEIMKKVEEQNMLS